jgi:hypothetical protein
VPLPLHLVPVVTNIPRKCNTDIAKNFAVFSLNNTNVRHRVKARRLDYREVVTSPKLHTLLVRMTEVSDFVHRPVFSKLGNQTFRNMDLFM